MDDNHAGRTRRKFLEEHRFGVLGVEREGKAPHLTPVYYTYLEAAAARLGRTRPRVRMAPAADATPELRRRHIAS